MLGLSEETYGALLKEYCPRVITSDEENEKVLSQIEGLMLKKEKSSEENELYLLLVSLVKNYEETEYPIENSSPHETLKHLMEERGLRQKDLEGVIGSKGVVSEVVNGKRSISKEQARNLAALFGVSPAVFIW